MTPHGPNPPPDQSSRADLFHALHHRSTLLLLANAWDVASAVVVESAGATAVATTSAGVAWSLGVPDGDRLGRDRAVQLIARVTEAVRVPVTADIESGFGADSDGVAETVRAVAGAGAVGINIEDVSQSDRGSLRPVAEQAERLAAARSGADAAGVRLYVNARVDTYLRGVGDPQSRLAETLVRAAAYLEAGADGIFVPGVGDLPTIGQLVSGIAAPLNVLVGAGSPSVSELSELGVRRVSLGSSVAAAAYAVAERATRELIEQGTYESVRGELDYDRLNRLVAPLSPG